MKRYREYIKKEGSMLDVSEKKKIIWGAGKNIRKYCSLLQLDDIEFVLDSDQSKDGSRIVLYGKEYTIQNPSVLKTLLPDDYMIMISSPGFRCEIMEQIRSEYGLDYAICELENQFVRGYYSIEDLFDYDPIINSKIVNGNISLFKDEIIRKANRAVENSVTCNDNLIYYSISEGIRLNFVVREEDGEEYYIHIPTKKHREEHSPSDERIIIESFEARRSVLPDEEILVYLDETGVEVSMCGDVKINWLETSNIKELICVIKRIHNCGIELRAHRYPLSRIKNKEALILNDGGYFPSLLSQKFHRVCDEELNIFVPKPCNGDLHVGNVVRYRERLQIIDWEWIGMSDPVWDIIYFITSIDYQYGENTSFEEYLEVYYGRKLVSCEMFHARIIRIAVVYYIYLCYVERNKNQHLEKEQHIRELIDEIIYDK